MEYSRTSNVIKNLAFAVLTNIIGTLFPFIVRTYMIRHLGSEYIGLNNLCSSILYVLSATDLGVANAFAFRLYKPLALGNKEAVCRLLNFYRKVYLVIGLIILSAGLVVMPFFKCFISQDIPDNVNVYFVFFLYLINAVISYTVFAYKNLIFTADQKKSYESITTSVTLAILYTVQIFFILAHKYYLSVCMLPFCTLMCNIARNLIATRKYPDYIPAGNILSSEALELRKDIFSVAIYKLRDISRNAFDNIIVSSFMGLVVLSNYQNYNMIFTVPTWILALMHTSLLPSVGNFAISSSPQQMYGIYKKQVFITSFLSAWFAICFGFLIQDFITLWLGAEFKLSWASAVLFSIYIYLYGEAMNIKTIREALGLWKQGKIWAIAEMAANLALNVLLTMRFGVEGVIISTIISILFVSIPAENKIIFSQYFAGQAKDKIKNMSVYALWTICTSVIVGLFCNFAPRMPYVSFSYKMCVCILIPPISCVLCFHKTDEFRYVRDTVKHFCPL